MYDTNLQKITVLLFQYGQAVSTDADDTGSFLCAHDPYFTLIPEQGCPPKFDKLVEAFEKSFSSNFKLDSRLKFDRKQTEEFANSAVCSLQFERLTRMRGRPKVRMEFQNEKWISI